MRFRLAAAAALLAGALTLGGCTLESPPPFEEMVERSAKASAELERKGHGMEFELDAALHIDPSPGAGDLAVLAGKEIKLQASGQVSEGKRVIDAKLGVGEQVLPFSYRGTSEWAYLGYGGVWAQTDPVERAASARAGVEGLGGEELKPGEIADRLKELRRAGVRAGEPRVKNGLYAYPLELDAERLARRLEDAGGKRVPRRVLHDLLEGLRAEVAFSPKTDLPERITVEFQAHGSTLKALGEHAPGRRAGEIARLELRIDLSMRPLGGPVAVERPPASAIVSEDELFSRLGLAALGLLGGLAPAGDASSARP